VLFGLLDFRWSDSTVCFNKHGFSSLFVTETRQRLWSRTRASVSFSVAIQKRTCPDSFPTVLMASSRSKVALLTGATPDEESGPTLVCIMGSTSTLCSGSEAAQVTVDRPVSEWSDMLSIAVTLVRIHCCALL